MNRNIELEELNYIKNHPETFKKKILKGVNVSFFIKIIISKFYFYHFFPFNIFSHIKKLKNIRYYIL